MRTPRKLIPIPSRIAAAIDQIAGPERRNAYIVELLENEVRRQEQLTALHQAAGAWKDEDHPELATGSEAWVRQMREESGKRSERLRQQAEAE